MKRVLFIVDKPGWAYDDAAQNWKILLKNEYNIDILYLIEYNAVRPDHRFYSLFKEYQDCAINGKSANLGDLISEKNLFLNKGVEARPIFDHNNYDIIYFFYHRAMCDSRLLATPIPLEKIVIAINNEKWTEVGAEKEYNTYMKGVGGIAVCNSFVEESFKGLHSNIFRVSQSINKNIFFKTKINNKNKRFTVGWSGNYKNPLKNFELIREAVSKTKARFIYANDLSRKDLNIWYNSLDCVICASKSEGGPLMLLEAGAVGLPVITAKVGLAREIINKNTGIFVENKETIISAVKTLMKDKVMANYISNNLQKEILNNWTYEARLHEIKAILKELCQ